MKHKILETVDKYTEKQKNVWEGYNIISEIEDVDLANSPKREVWHDGKMKLYQYDRETEATIKTPLLISYALVNTYKMMDLQPDRSLIRRFLDLGLEVYIIDWGTITRADRYTNMEDYIDGYIDGCVDFVAKKHNLEKINLLGVCQGGTFSTIYTALNPHKIKNLITMVTPIDFNHDDGLLFRWSRDMDIDELVDNFGGIIPGEFLNAGFDMLKPLAKARKYNNLHNVIGKKDKLLNFLRMEKWVADSPDQAGECYRKFVKDLYQNNKLIKGEFELGGRTVDLKNLTVPLLNIYAAADHLVPPSCSIPLEQYVGTKDVQTYEFPGGHIGVFVGSRAQKELSPTIIDWLKERDN